MRVCVPGTFDTALAELSEPETTTELSARIESQPRVGLSTHRLAYARLLSGSDRLSVIVSVWLTFRSDESEKEAAGGEFAGKPTEIVCEVSARSPIPSSAATAMV